MKATVLASLSVLVMSLSSAALAEPVGWRMDGDGRYPGTTPPTTWSATANVAWKAPMPSWSNASPVWLEDRDLLFVLSEPDEILAVRAKDGEVAWKRSVGDVVAETPDAHRANGWATPTPVSDGSRVFSLFGSGAVSAHSVDGERLWAKVVQQPTHRWGHSASPVLAGGKLIVHLIDLIALDPATGKEAWRAETPVKWGSPVVTEVGGKEVVITPAGDVFVAESGKKIASEIGKLEYAAPVIEAGVVYFIEKQATAVRLPKTLDGEFENLWTARVNGSRHYASPVIHDGLIYAVSREEQFSILDAKTGELVFEKKLDLGDASGSNSAYPSVTQAGGKIFVSVENGTTAVLEPGREYREVARNSLDGFRSSPVFVGDRVYIRTFEALFCLAPAG